MLSQAREISSILKNACRSSCKSNELSAENIQSLFLFWHHLPIFWQNTNTLACAASFTFNSQICYNSLPIIAPCVLCKEWKSWIDRLHVFQGQDVVLFYLCLLPSLWTSTKIVFKIFSSFSFLFYRRNWWEHRHTMEHSAPMTDMHRCMHNLELKHDLLILWRWQLCKC